MQKLIPRHFIRHGAIAAFAFFMLLTLTTGTLTWQIVDQQAMSQAGVPPPQHLWIEMIAKNLQQTTVNFTF